MENEKKSAKKVLSVIGNILIWLFVAFSVVVTILAFAAQASPDGLPTISGKAILTVQTPSMKPVFDVGDIIIGRKLTEEEKTVLNVGDIITFNAGDLNGDGKEDLNTHRIKEVIKDEAGFVTYTTKGDNNAIEDNAKVRAENVVCIYTGTRIAKLGTFLNFLQQPTGFLVVIVLPLLAFFIFELIRFIRKFIQVKNADKPKITAEEEELIKQKAIEEYLRSQQKAAEDEASRNKPQEESGENADQPEEAPEEQPAEAADDQPKETPEKKPEDKPEDGEN